MARQRNSSFELLRIVAMYVIVVSLLAGYYRLYGEWPLGRLGRALGRPSALPLMIICYVAVVAGRVLAARAEYAPARGVVDPLANMQAEESPVVLLISMELVSLSAGTRPWHSRAVNGVAATMFGVYCIHDNVFARL